MKKEPLIFYILRLMIGIATLGFLGMIYWSSLSLEYDSKKILQKLEEIRKIPATQVVQPLPAAETSTTALPESAFPNLLIEDPFYKVTLPKLLGSNFTPSGIRQEDALGKPDHLHPFSNWSNVSTWIGLCVPTVSRQLFGKYETMAPDIALKMESRGSEFWVYLRQNVYWQPLNPAWFTEDIHLAPHFFQKHQVTAHDFKFFFDAMINPHNQEPGAVALRTLLGDIEEVTVKDDFTFVVRWKTDPVQNKVRYIAKQLTGSLRPLPRFVYQYMPDGQKIVEEDQEPNTYRNHAVWAQQFSLHWARNIIVSCGAWLFDGMTDRQIRFKRNPEHYFQQDVLVEALEVSFKDTVQAMWQDFAEGKIDLYGLPPDQLSEYEQFLDTPIYQQQKEQKLAIDRIDYVSRVYYYVGWNEKRLLFSSKKVRQAMTMAIDRQRIIDQILHGMGVQITGPFFINSPSNDPSIEPWPYDPRKARKILEEEGWYDSNADGLLDKEIDGKKVPFRFNLVYFVKNLTTKSICEYVSTALKEVGIECNLNGVDIADLSAVFDDKDFDALCLGWALGTPPEDPKQLWYSTEATTKGSSNAIGFMNTEADQIIDDLVYEYDPEKRLQLYHSFCRIIHEEAPYTFLYTPKQSLLFREYVKNIFIPKEHPDLIPGANVAEPDTSILWLQK